MTQSQSSAPSAATLSARVLVGGLIAAGVNVALLFGARALGVSMEGAFTPGQPAGVLPLPAVVLASLIPGIPAVILALLLIRFTKAPAKVFGIISVVFTILSLAGPLGVAGASLGTRAVMEVMHVVAALGLGGSVYRTLRG